MTALRRRHLLLLTLVAAAPAHADRNTPVLGWPGRTHPVGALAPDPYPPDCEVVLVMAALPQADGSTRLVARAMSRVDRPLEITVPRTCPGGPARFTGLSDTHDFYGTCNAGACLPTVEGRRPLTIPARGLVDLAEAWVHPAGTDCTAALAPGDHAVTYTIDLRGAVTCGPSANTVHVPAPPGPPPPAPPPTAVPDCPPSPTCGVVCDGPPLRDAQGCSLCGCEDLWGTSPSR